MSLVQSVRTVIVMAACALLLAMAGPVAAYAAPEDHVGVKLKGETLASCLKVTCVAPSMGNDVRLKVDLGTKFAKSGLQVISICFDATFAAANPLDADEQYEYATLGGARNIGPTALLSRQSCFVDSNGNLADFQDGKAVVHLYAVMGSFAVTNVHVEYTTEPAR